MSSTKFRLVQPGVKGVSVLFQTRKATCWFESEKISLNTLNNIAIIVKNVPYET